MRDQIVNSKTNIFILFCTFLNTWSYSSPIELEYNDTGCNISMSLYILQRQKLLWCFCLHDTFSIYSKLCFLLPSQDSIIASNWKFVSILVQIRLCAHLLRKIILLFIAPIVPKTSIQKYLVMDLKSHIISSIFKSSLKF